MYSGFQLLCVNGWFSKIQSHIILLSCVAILYHIVGYEIATVFQVYQSTVLHITTLYIAL